MLSHHALPAVPVPSLDFFSVCPHHNCCTYLGRALARGGWDLLRNDPSWSGDLTYRLHAAILTLPHAPFTPFSHTCLCGLSFLSLGAEDLAGKHLFPAPGSSCCAGNATCVCHGSLALPPSLLIYLLSVDFPSAVLNIPCSFILLQMMLVATSCLPPPPHPQKIPRD